MSDELKPCAHCAEPGIEVEQRRGDFHKWSIECSGCYCRTDWYGSREAAVAAWNKRADDAPISEKPAPSLKESAEDTQVFTDSRGQLEADVRNQTECSWVTAPHWKVVDWLDRQAAITEREVVEACQAEHNRSMFLGGMKHQELQMQVDKLTAERDELQSIIDHMPKTEAECEACQEAHDRLMFNAKVDMDELRDKLRIAENVSVGNVENALLRYELKHKQRVIDRQRDSFAKMERECAELRRMLADAAEAI